MSTTPRCAICDCDREGNVWPESADSLCAAHYRLAGKRDLVLRAALSDWEPMGVNGAILVSHRTMLLRPAMPPLYWQASILALLTCAGVVWDDGEPWQESPGDFMAGNWLIDWAAINGGNSGKAA